MSKSTSLSLGTEFKNKKRKEIAKVLDEEKSKFVDRDPNIVCENLIINNNLPTKTFSVGCGYNSTKNVVDLNNVKKSEDIVDNKFLTTDDDLKELPVLLYGDKIKLFPVSKIGSGGQGSVYAYDDNTKQYEIIVKFTSDKDHDMTCILEERKVNCNNIGARYLGKVRDFFVIVMWRMSGDLLDLDFRNTPETIKMDIMKYIIEILMCVEKEAHLKYTDLKPQNVLYKCVKNNSIVIVLGDLGGFTNNGTIYLPHTPPEPNELRTIKAEQTPNDFVTLGLCKIMCWLYGCEKLKYREKELKKYPDVLNFIQTSIDSKDLSLKEFSNSFEYFLKNK